MVRLRQLMVLKVHLAVFLCARCLLIICRLKGFSHSCSTCWETHLPYNYEAEFWGDWQLWGWWAVPLGCLRASPTGGNAKKTDVLVAPFCTLKLAWHQRPYFGY